MITKKRSAIVSSSFGLYCVGLGLVLGGIVVGLNWYDKAVRQSHADPTELEQRAPAGREAKDATWTVHIQTVDKALAQKNIGLAERAWRDAHAAALRSGRWDSLVEVGDAYLRLGEAAGYRKASEARTRGTYWAALLRAPAGFP